MDEIVVSVCCTTYNQEKFIRRCLDSLINQECSFKYEIIVHDDASTDGTAEIVKDYADKYPDLIVPIFQEENQYSKGIDIISLLLEYVHGKYLAFCEGDDYWIDSEKIEKQVVVMENNPNCHLSLHKVRSVNEDETPTGRMHPNFNLKTGEFSGEQLLDYICTNEYVFQTTSYFMQINEVKSFFVNSPKYKNVAATGDTPLLLFLSLLGNVYYIDEVMSCYRHSNPENHPRISNYLNTEEKIVAHYNKQILMMEEFDKYTNGKYHKLCQRKIDGYHFDRAVRNKDYKELCKKKYKFFKKGWTSKEKIYVFLSAYFPSVLTFFNKG